MNDQLRALWEDLSQRYRFLYGLTLQERLAEMRPDVADWWWVGGLKVPRLAGPTRAVPHAGPSHASVAVTGPRRSSPAPAPRSLAEPEPVGERPLAGLPDVVKRTILAVAAETGVSPAEILGRKTTRRCSDARRECVKRLRRLRYGAPGGRPSQAQIGAWLRRDHTTICRTLKT